MKYHRFKALDYFYSMWFNTSGWVLPYLLKRIWFIPEGRTATGREGNGRTRVVFNKQFKIRNQSNTMVASCKKNTTQFLTEYLHFSCPFDNFLRCLACATYIAVGKKSFPQQMSTGSTEIRYTPQVNSCQPDIGIDTALPCQTASEIIPTGNVFIEHREMPGNTKEGLTTGSSYPNSGCMFSLCAGAAQAVAQLENGF